MLLLIIYSCLLMLTHKWFSVCGGEELHGLRTEQRFFAAQGLEILTSTKDSFIARLNLYFGQEIHPWNRSIQLKIELPYDLVVPLLGMYLKKSKTLIREDTCIPMFI